MHSALEDTPRNASWASRYYVGMRTKKHDPSPPPRQSSTPTGGDSLKRPRWLSWKRIETLVTVALLLFVAHRLWPQFSTLVGVGGPVGQAPQFALETLDGHRVSLADYDGQVVLVNFWATWCTPCRLEMPGFQKLYRDKREKGFVILGIATDRGDRAGVEAFLAERGIEYPVALQTREVNLAFGGVSAIPTSFLIDRSGVIRHRIFGFMPPPVLRVAVNRLLDEPAATEVP